MTDKSKTSKTSKTSGAENAPHAPLTATDPRNVTVDTERVLRPDLQQAAAPAQADVADASKKPKKPKKSAFCFTDPGCRTEVRLGALLTVGPIFLWMWLKPDTAVYFLVIGLPLLWAGIPIQALQARKHLKQPRPGYPWKLGIVFTLLGGLMIPDQISRVIPDGPMHVQIQAPALCLSGLWILGWWLLCARRGSRDGLVESGTGAALHG